MARKPLNDDQLGAASRRCAELLVRAGDAEPTIAELAAHAGLSERTFYRYFPTKEDALRPLFAAANLAFAERLAQQVAEHSLVDALVLAGDGIVRDEGVSSVRALMSIVYTRPPLRRVWLEAVYDAAEPVRAAIADTPRLRSDPMAAALAGGQVSLILVLAFERLIADGTPIAETVRAAAESVFGSA